MALFFRNDLNKLATIWGTDKWNSHRYTQHYQNHFKKFKNKKIKILEIGVGGYEDPNLGGNSLFMWKSFFPKAQICSLDIYDKSPLEQKRIKIYKGSQIDKEFLEKINNESGPFDIIIDDGSHLNEHVIDSFKILFPMLKEGGLYVVEDMQTSYWPEFGGSSEELVNHQDSSVNYFRNLVHSLNFEEILKSGYVSTYFDRHITAISFYHNMVFVQKNVNNEGSNLVLNNKFVGMKDVF